MLKGIEAAIFDFDGTLVDSMWLWHAIDVEFLGRYGIECPKDLGKSIESLSFTQTAEYFKHRFSLRSTVEEIIQEWERMSVELYATKVSLKPGAAAFLEKLRQNGIKVAMATSNTKNNVEAVLKKYNISEYFHTIITSCEIGKGKSSPDIYLETARRLDVKASGCLVFEDILAAIRSAKAAGMRVCAVDDAYTREQRREKEEIADYFIVDYAAE